MNLSSRLLLLAAFGGVLAAQDAPSAQTKAQGPLLVVESSSPRMLMGMAQSLHCADMPEEPAEGQHFMLTLGADKQATLKAVDGASPYLQVRADPAGLMKAYAEQIEGSRAMIQAMGGAGMVQAGVDPQMVKSIFDAIFEFPTQLEAMTLVVTGEPMQLEEKGMTVDLTVQPMAASPFGRAMQKMKPCAQGAPVLGGEGMISAQMSLDADCMRGVLSPFMDAIVAMTFAPGEARDNAQKMYKDWIEQYDGGAAFRFGDKGGMDCLVGVLDGKHFADVLASDDYAAMVKAQKPVNRNTEMSFEPNALEHHGTKLHKMHMEMDGPPNPVAPDGKMDMLLGAVGNYMIMGASADSAKQLVDAAADKKVKRQPLSGGAVMTMEMSMAQFAAQMGQPVSPGAPQTVSVAFVPKGKDLLLHIELH